MIMQHDEYGNIPRAHFTGTEIRMIVEAYARGVRTWEGYLDLPWTKPHTPEALWKKVRDLGFKDVQPPPRPPRGPHKPREPRAACDCAKRFDDLETWTLRLAEEVQRLTAAAGRNGWFK